MQTDRPAAALALRATHPHAPALDVLDVVFRGGGPLPPMPLPPEPFALLVAEALDLGMRRDDWASLMRPDGDPRVHAALHAIWRDEVWPLFVARYVGAALSAAKAAIQGGARLPSLEPPAPAPRRSGRSRHR